MGSVKTAPRFEHFDVNAEPVGVPARHDPPSLYPLTRSHFVGTRSHLAHALREVPRGLQTASYGARRLYATSCDCRRARLQWANLLDGHSHGLALPPHVQAFASGQRVRRMCA